jgi:hypothetical protein
VEAIGQGRVGVRSGVELSAKEGGSVFGLDDAHAVAQVVVECQERLAADYADYAD